MGLTMKYTGYELLWLILIYSFAGWCMEVCTAAARHHKLVNRGFLNAPFCMLYGASAAAFAIFLPDLKDHPVFLFLGGMILASFLEYWTGRVMERLFHRKWWDYSGEKWQLDGYICLRNSVLLGLFAVLTIKFANPLLLSVVHMLPRPVGNVFLWVVYLILAADAAGTTVALLELHHKLKRIDQLTEDLQRLSDSLGNAITRRIQRRMMGAYPNISLQNLLEERKKEQERQRAAERVIFGYGCSIYKLISLFFIGAFMGDIVETVFVYVTAGKLMSRSSVVYGPFSIVWGLGCVMLTVFLYRYRDSSDRLIFTAGTVLGGAYEYFCSVFTERMFGTVFWDYSAIPFNLGGRINLLFCFFWGIVAVIWLKLIYPPLSSWIEKIPVRAGKIVCNVLAALMAVDILISGIAMGRYSERQAQIPGNGPVAEYFDEHFPDERIESRYPNLRIVK